MLKKINRQECLDQYSQLAHFEDEDVLDEDGGFFYPKVFSSYNLTHKSKSFKAHVNTLATEITNLMKQLGFSTLLFLPNSNTPWLETLDKSEPSLAAALFFAEHKISNTFSGGLMLSDKFFAVFFKHLLWMIRCNEAFPIIHFTDQRQQIMACICSYGSLHLDVLNPELDPVFRSKIEHSKLEMIGLESCAVYADSGIPPNLKKRRHLRKVK
jgi:hypothetical protein